MLFVILQLSDSGSLLFTTATESTKGEMMRVITPGYGGPWMGVQTLRQPVLGPPTNRLCSNSFFSASSVKRHMQTFFPILMGLHV